MSVCFASAGIVKSLSAAAFMLAWTHSVEKTEWQEDWHVTPQGLEIVEARVKGSGAGMEPSPDARLIDGWFRWKPQMAPLPEVVLGNSGMAGEWRLCSDGACRTLSEVLGHPVGTGVTTMSICKPDQEEKALDAKALLARGDESSIRGDLDRALADYDAALKADPGFAEALNSRGMAWRAKGDRRRALLDFDAALKLKPSYDAARANRTSLFNEIERLGAQMPLKKKGDAK